MSLNFFIWQIANNTPSELNELMYVKKYLEECLLHSTCFIRTLIIIIIIIILVLSEVWPFPDYFYVFEYIYVYVEI